MTDKTRALLLPDWFKPSDAVLKSLALYWDEIVVPDATYRTTGRALAKEIEKPPELSQTALSLQSAGILRRDRWDVAAESIIPRSPDGDPDGEDFLRIAKGDDGRYRFATLLRVARSRIADSPPSDVDEREIEKRDDSDLYEAARTLDADLLMARSRRCLELCAMNNLAPVAPSIMAHLAALSSDDKDGDEPISEGALIGVAVDAFEVREDTPVEAVIEFRERNLAAVQRFRAAMTDVGAALREGSLKPEAALAAARDIYLNRVAPDLGLLEDRLKESRVKFLARSLFGAAALAVTPLTTPLVVESAARIGAQTINYRFSRKRLLDEHPYGYLQRVAVSDLVTPRQLSGLDLVSPDVNPTTAVYRLYDVLAELARGMADSDLPSIGVPRYEIGPRPADH